MRYFPAFLDLRDAPVLLLGGGEVALRKARLLIAAGARLHWVTDGAAPGPLDPLGPLSAGFSLSTLPASAADFVSKRVAIVAIEAPDRRRALVDLARAARVPVNAVDDAALSDFVVPSIVDRGAVTIAIGTGGAAPVLARRLRARIESLLPARLDRLVAFAGQRRDAVAARVAAPQRRQFWERVFDGAIAEAVLDGDEETAARLIDRAMDTAGGPGTGVVHLVGAGPGDPELLTLRALRVLQDADVVFHDRLVSAAVLGLIRRDAERVDVGKRRADHTVPQTEIIRQMIDAARHGRRVVRLKGGDPMIFGRGGEEATALAEAGISVHVVPGITAAQGVAPRAGIALTRRRTAQAVTLVTGEAGGGGAPDVNWQALAALGQTIAVYMGTGRAAEIAGALIAGGMSPATPVTLIENGTRPDERIVDTKLDGMADAAATMTGPCMLIIGAVADPSLRARETLAVPQLESVA